MGPDTQHNQRVSVLNASNPDQDPSPESDSRIKPPPGRRSRFARPLAGAVAVFALLTLAHDSDLLGHCTRTVAVWLIQQVGVEASNGETHLLAGHLTIPWSRDCAGFSIFVVLPAITIWGHIHGPVTRWGMLRFLLVLPVAFAINLLRILSLVAVRFRLYPEVETLELHFALGFFWLIPFLPIFVPGIRKNPGRACTETLHIATVLSLLTPLMNSPGGNLVGICVLTLLATLRENADSQPRRPFLFFAWTIAGVAIGLYRLQSLWIPWLLVCPTLVARDKLRSPVVLSLLLGTVPMFAMNPAGAVVIVIALLLESRKLREIFQASAESAPRCKAGLLELATTMVFLVPFLSNTILASIRFEEPLPGGVIVTSSSDRSHQFQLFGQSPDIDLFWFDPGTDRHHTIEVCMKYRDVELQPTDVPHVLTDGGRFYREYFRVRGQFLNDYRTYVAMTLLPMSNPGAHIIIVSRDDSMTASAFGTLADRSIDDLVSLSARGR